MIEIHNKELEDLLIYATRYALGRQTYAVSDVCRALHNYKNKLSDKCRYVIEQDILHCQNYGSEYDKNYWMNILKELG